MLLKRKLNNKSTRINTCSTYIQPRILLKHFRFYLVWPTLLVYAIKYMDPVLTQMPVLAQFQCELSVAQLQSKFWMWEIVKMISSHWHLPTSPAFETSPAFLSSLPGPKQVSFMDRYTFLSGSQLPVPGPGRRHLSKSSNASTLASCWSSMCEIYIKTKCQGNISSLETMVCIFSWVMRTM